MASRAKMRGDRASAAKALAIHLVGFAALMILLPGKGLAQEGASILDLEIAKIIAERSHQQRQVKALGLARYVTDLSDEDKARMVDDAAIDGLVVLLEDRSLSTLVAVTLGQFGPKASRAVPALETAYAEVCAYSPPVSTGPDDDAEILAIALAEITGQRPSCR